MGKYLNRDDQIEHHMPNELYEESYKNPKHFSFGKNWKNFLKNLTGEKIEEAEKSLVEFLGGKENISGKTFIDIGCGSGLFSLAAYRLGAKRVVSVDIDDSSVACVKYLNKKNNSPEQWTIKTGSALDKKFLSSLGNFDIVYSWGVLHHTGNMYQALENVTLLAHTESKLYIALYNDNQRFIEGTSKFWLKAKMIYNKCSSLEKRFFQLIYTTYYIIGLTLNFVNPIAYIKNYHSLRGMSFMTDIKDWLGGYPYEYATTEQITEFFAKQGFNCEKTVPARSIGCNEFLLVSKK
jgi:2-polyprenyl-3-methyl-5-hydroxy-6-metoxy-1,4-benzoquinol methylase